MRLLRAHDADVFQSSDQEGYAALRVLFFTSDVSSQSGASHALREIAKRLASVGMTLTLVLPDLPDTREMFPQNQFRVRYVKMHRLRRTLNPFLLIRGCWSFLKLFILLRSLIVKYEIDVLHSNEIMDLAGGLAARSTGIPSVFHVRADGLSNFYRFLLAKLLHFSADAIIVPSRSTEEWLGHTNALLRKKIRQIPDFAFDYAAFNPSNSGVEFRHERNIPADAIVVLLVSKLVVDKGHLCFISAAKQVVTQAPNFFFVIVGEGVQGHPRDAAEIVSFAAQCEISPNLQLVGKRNDLPTVYAAADIVVHCPIFPDTYPTVVLLAMLMGKPIIASKIGGISEQIEDGITGLLVEPNNASALAHAVLDLGNNHAKRVALGMDGMQRLREQFSPHRHAEAIVNLYRNLVMIEAKA